MMCWDLFLFSFLFHSLLAVCFVSTKRNCTVNETPTLDKVLMSVLPKYFAIDRVFADVFLFRNIIEFIEDKENECCSYPILILALSFKTMHLLIRDPTNHFQLKTKVTQFVHSVSLLQWVLDEGRPFPGSTVHVAASRCGPAHVISWLDNYDSHRWTADCFTAAADMGRLSILEQLDSGLDAPCPVDSKACAAASRTGNLQIFQWLVHRNKPLDSDSFHEAALHNHEHIFRWSFQHGISHTTILTSGTFTNAAFGGHLELLKYLVSQPFQRQINWNLYICRSAARNGHLDILQYARGLTPPCPWDERVCAVAALGGHLHLLRWARTQREPCPWDATACTQAAFGGHLDVMSFLRAETGHPPCPWSHDACCAAAATGNLELLQWLRAQDPPCPWTYHTHAAAVFNRHSHILTWMDSISAPCPKAPSFGHYNGLHV
jgi:hypothetical protein